jgi:hypothetical protein
MNKKTIGVTILFLCFIFSVPAFSQLPDSDADGVPDDEDVCPFLKGIKNNKGCPEEEKKSAAATYITQQNFDEILETICENAMPGRKAAGAIGEKTMTTFSLNGKDKNLPVTYYVAKDMKSIITHIPLSKVVTEYEEVLKYVNKLFANSSACWGAYKKIVLERPKAGQDASGIYATTQNSLFASLINERVSTTETRVQLNILKTIYPDNKKTIAPVTFPTNKKTVPVAGKPFAIVLKPGNKLIYNWSDGIQNFKFLITLKKIGSVVSYEYEITPGDNLTVFKDGLTRLRGTTTIIGTALTKPDDYYLIMQDNTNYTLNENFSSLLWISKKVHTELASAKRKTIFSINGENKGEYQFSLKDKKYPISLNGRIILAGHVEAFHKKDGLIHHTLNILDNIAFPLLLKIQTPEFSLTLHDIITQ